MDFNAFLNTSDTLRPFRSRTPKKQKTPTFGDRFIPTRLSSPDSSESLFIPRTAASLAFEERLNNFTCKFTPYASKKTNRKSVLFFGSPYQNIASTQLQKQFTHQQTCKKLPKISLVRFRILDAPDVGDNFYNQVLTWSSSDHVSIALNHPGASTVYSLSIYATKPAAPITSPEPLTDQTICSIASLDSNNTVSGWDNGYLRLNQTGTDHNYHYEYAASSHALRSIAITSPHTLICGDANGLISAVDVRNKQTVARVQTSHNLPTAAEIPGLAYDNGTYVASGSKDGQVRLWDIRRLTKNPVHTQTTHTAAVKALAFWPKKPQCLISGGGATCGHLSLWNTTTNQVKYTLNTGSEITGIHCFQNDPRYFVTSHGYGDLSVKLWHIEKHKISLQSTFNNLEAREQTGRSLCLAGSPNTNDFATVTSTEALHLFKPHGLNKRMAQTTPLLLGGSEEFSKRLVIR